MMWAVYGAQFLAILGIDRLTKYLSVQYVLHGRAIELNQFAEIKVVFNRGISWGMFHSEHCILFSLLTLLIVCIISVLARAAYVRHRLKKPIYAEIAVLAGAVSNVIDRITYGGVVDFIHLHVGDVSWPIFNIADVAIVLGILWMIKGYYYES